MNFFKAFIFRQSADTNTGIMVVVVSHSCNPSHKTLESFLMKLGGPINMKGTYKQNINHAKDSRDSDCMQSFWAKFI